jgi:hypothetical protein
MPRLSSLAAALAAVLVTGGCDLNVENPNAPDAPRAFSDPAGLQQLLGGAFRTWVEARSGYFVMPLPAMADNYTTSWNNAAIRFYSSVGAECPSRCGWSNSATAAEAAGGPTVEAQWYGYYSVLAAANNVLLGIKNGVCFDDDCTVNDSLTSRNKAIAQMMQGMALAGISLAYDQGFYVDENTPPSEPSAIPFSTRAALRDSALKRFEDAWTQAGLRPFETEAQWMGVDFGTSYTSTQIRQVIRTMEAELIAMWPRNAGENAAADWAQVATYASQGVSSGTPFDWEFYIDVGARECGIDCVKNWGNSILTERVDTRVAAMITTNHVDPWPDPNGNPCPTISPDKRVGDGTFGTSDDADYGTVAATANAGTDFACSDVAPFPAARGQYHQSNLQHIRYEALASRGENLPIYDGTGQDPFYTTQMNDLLWAEGLLRRPAPDLATAATLINNSRVGRGGLSTLTAADGAPALLAALQYEQEIEFMGQGATPFFNRRRVDGLLAGTPRHMPVPALELDGLGRAVYSFGGPSSPDMSAGADGGKSPRPTVLDRWRRIQSLARSLASRRRS